jgi:hypothetical protein
MVVQVAKSAAKTHAVIFAMLGTGTLAAFLSAPVKGGAGARATLVVLLPGLSWLLATYFASARLEWDAETLSTIRFGCLRRTVRLGQLARVETKRGGAYYVVTDRLGHSVQLPPLLFTRRGEWARVLIDAIRVSGATTDPQADHFLTQVTSPTAS